MFNIVWASKITIKTIFQILLKIFRLTETIDILTDEDTNLIFVTHTESNNYLSFPRYSIRKVEDLEAKDVGFSPNLSQILSLLWF